MAKFTTTQGIPVTNYTRYETADLLAICNLVEERILSVNNTIWVKGYARSPSTGITFVDYGTRIHFHRRREWVNGTSIQKEVRNYTDSQGSWGNISGTVKIVPPSKIHLDPLAALAADNTKLPFPAIQAIYSEVSNIYSTAREAESAVKLPLPDSMQVRINKRKAEKKDKVKNYRSICRANMKRKYWNGAYYTGRAIDAMWRCMKNLKVAGTHAKKCGETPPDLARLQEMMAELEEIRKSYNNSASALGV